MSPSKSADPKPRYLRIAAAIETELLPTIAPGERLPSETQLAARFDVHRQTIRESLTSLHRLGLIFSRQGKGTFRSVPFDRYEVCAGPASLSETMRAQGRAVTNRCLGSQLDADPPDHVRFGVEQPALRIDTFRLVDDEPWSLTSTWFHPHRLADIDRHWPGDHGSLAQVLDEHYRLRLRRDVRSFSAIPADARVSEFLGIRVGDPTLRVRGTNVDDKGEPLVAIEHLFAGFRVEFVTKLGQE